MSSFILDIHFNPKKEVKNVRPFSLEYNTSSKFKNDKVNFENDEYYILIDGIILNKKQLLDDSTQTGWTDYLIESYQNLGVQFFKHLKGSYFGFLFDKKAEKWIVFTDHISSKPIYYTEFYGHIVFSNSFIVLMNHLKKSGRSISLNEQGAYILLTYGYVFEDITIIDEIKRLLVGKCAVIQNGQLQFEKFYTLTNNPIEISEYEAIEQIDKLFREAVQLAFEKDKEYGYKHVATLSGGLDSRMAVWVAHDLGYTDQLNLTFSQSNYLDETIAKQIATDLKHDWIFKALDNGNFLKNIDETTQITGGNVIYYGSAHGISLYNYLNFDNLGILHSGQLGDVIIGTYASQPEHLTTYSNFSGTFSSLLKNRILPIHFQEEYINEEVFKMNIRGFYGINQGLMGIREHTETYSPFYDIDFMEFALKIPLKFRFKHRIYKKWILKKYPNAAVYPWEKTNKSISKKEFYIKIRGKYIPIEQIIPKTLIKLGLKPSPIATKFHMNPLEYWYQTNPQLKEFMDNYFYEHIKLLNAYPQLKTDCEKLYAGSKGTEKVQVLSLLGILKIIKQ